MRTDSQIIEELLKRKVAGTLNANDQALKGDATPISEIEFAKAENRLGFKLPTLLRRIYIEVANGGFGESYGLLGLVGGPVNEDGLDAVSLYEVNKRPDPSDKFWTWPNALLPLGHLGCAMYHCIKCDQPPFPVIWFEPNPHATGESWDDAFFPFCPSLNEYISAWLDNEDLWSKLT